MAYIIFLLLVFFLLGITAKVFFFFLGIFGKVLGFIFTLAGYLFVGILGVVGLGLREDGRHALLEELARDALDVIAVDQTQARESRDTEDVLELTQQLACLYVKTRLLLYIDAKDHEAPLGSSSRNDFMIRQAER